MACRIGITTDLKSRKAYWSAHCKCFENWEILGGPYSRDIAQKMETIQAGRFGCDAHPGGADPNEVGNGWYVYKFDHCGCSS